ncbi:MAG: hypothetical protein ABJK37_02640 [Paraglaciecola sp.]|uniref:hypothetical protein n=1 Tax=Paraglaciecola sp. TaxID=1920173 RepID=UPI003299BB85
MKFLTLVAAIILTIVSSAMAVSQTVESKQVELMPASIDQLKIALENADRGKTDRNSVLRLERAEFYYSSAVEYFKANWRTKAIDYAHRGRLLVELHQRSVEKNGFYRPELAKAQQASLRVE